MRATSDLGRLGKRRIAQLHLLIPSQIDDIITMNSENGIEIY